LTAAGVAALTAAQTLSSRSVSRFGGKADVRRIPQLSLNDLLATNALLGDGHLLVALKCYFDGSNEADSTQYDVVSLAGVSGTSEEWARFEADWNENLNKHKAAYLHTTDAATFSKDFSRNRGWDARRRDQFLDDCSIIADSHIARPIDGDDPGRMGLYPFVVTVVLKDYLRARKDHPDVPPTAEEILVTQVLHGCLKWDIDYIGSNTWHLFFDQNEPYRGHVCDRQNKREMLRKFPLMKKVVENAEADMRHVPALQLADLFAWCVSQKNRKRPFNWQDKVLSLDRGHMWEWLDYAALTHPIPGMTDLMKSWKLPKRKPTR
jgi:hypothetical protein